jgi:chromosome segregation ATPase
MSNAFAALAAEGKRWAAMRDAFAMGLAEELLRTRDAMAEAVVEHFAPIQEAHEELSATTRALREAAAQLPGQLDELQAEAVALAEELSEASTDVAQVIDSARTRGAATAALVALALTGDSDALASVRKHAAEGDVLAVRVLRVRHRIQTARKRVRRLSRKVARLLAVELVREITTAHRQEHFPSRQANAPPARASVRVSKATGPVHLLPASLARKDGAT